MSEVNNLKNRKFLEAIVSHLKDSNVLNSHACKPSAYSTVWLIQ